MKDPVQTAVSRDSRIDVTCLLKHRSRVSLFIAIVLVWAVITLGAWLSMAVHRGELEGLQWSTESPPGLGGENNSIALAIREGRGFADPFYQPTGPTAWMPPAMPGLLATLYAVLDDDRASVTQTFFGLLWGTFGLIGTAAVFYADRAAGRPLAMALVFAVGAWALYYPIFLFTHGHVLEVIAVSIVLIALMKLQTPSIGCSWFAGVSVGLAALAYPAAAIGFFLVAAWQLRRHRLLWLNTALAATVVVSPWLGRNLAKFGTLYPIKSNASYELWQSLELSETGTLTSGIFSGHPYFAHTAQHAIYKRDGEKVFLQTKAVDAKKLIFADPMRLVPHIKNRFIAALIWEEPWLMGQSRSWWTLGVGRLWKLWVLASLAIVLWHWRSIPPTALLAASLMLCILLPYVLVSYYERYAWPVFPLQLIVVFHATFHRRFKNQRWTSTGF